MQKVVGVAFNKKGRVYNFSTNNHDLNIGDTVIVETEKGYQYGHVITNIKEIDENEFNIPLKDVVRLTTKKDDQNYFKNASEGSIVINDIHQPAFWMFIHLYAPLYQPTGTNKIDQPLQLFFNLNL